MPASASHRRTEDRWASTRWAIFFTLMSRGPAAVAGAFCISIFFIAVAARERTMEQRHTEYATGPPLTSHANVAAIIAERYHTGMERAADTPGATRARELRWAAY